MPPTPDTDADTTPSTEQTPTGAAINEERFAALETAVGELAALFRGTTPNPGGGDGNGSAATGTPSPPPVPADRDGIRAIVRDLLDARDGESRIAAMYDELAELRRTVEDKLTPPKRSWGSWIVGSR